MKLIATPSDTVAGRNSVLWWRMTVLITLIATLLVIWISHFYLTLTFSEQQSTKSRLRATLYAGSIQSTLQRHAVVPLLLSRDPVLLIALRAGQFAGANERLEAFQEELGSGEIFLLSNEGRVVSSSDQRTVDQFEGDQSYFSAALAGEGTKFSISTLPDGTRTFHYSRKLVVEEQLLGIIVVTVGLGLHEQGWLGANALVAVSDSDGAVLLASDPAWRGLTLDRIVDADTNGGPMRDALHSAGSWLGQYPYVYIDGTPHLATTVPIGFRNWRLTFFGTLEDVRARTNTFLALIIMLLALLLALGFYLILRRTRAEGRRIKRESDDLRQLNQRLSYEIAARQRLERNLKDAEQSLEQASKLAALGQMSAAVSHELNQPLAAMKTYLAGARLLLRRKRGDEALSSFQRIDDLIDRMTGITRQLKSYARKGDVDLVRIDMRDSVRSALSMMSPQLDKMAVEITTTLPSDPVPIEADPLRIEQIIVNLLRNALDAVSRQKDRKVRILLVEGETIFLSIADNGTGLDDPDKLFEPFYTTKKPGEGLGLGLAISAGFAAEMGGRLLARNAPDGGAIFELVLPRLNPKSQAAE